MGFNHGLCDVCGKDGHRSCDQHKKDKGRGKDKGKNKDKGNGKGKNKKGENESTR